MLKRLKKKKKKIRKNCQQIILGRVLGNLRKVEYFEEILSNL